MKILILKPQGIICYGILDVLANNFGDALARKGIEIVYFDMKKENIQNLSSHINEKYDAVIDFYSGLLSVKLQQPEGYLWDCIGAPVFQICLDFPVYIMDTMSAWLQKYYVLCLDKYYINVIKECMPHITNAYFFPMAGKSKKRKIAWEERVHDLVFIGSYANYREWLMQLNQYEEGIRNIGYTFFCIMKNNTGINQKQAFEMTLSQLNIQLSRQEFYQWMKKVGGIALAAAAYQRERVVETILQAGLQLEVYGNSWKASPLAQYPNLIINEAVCEEKYISTLERTKLSLNIMYCNKAGYSERYSYSMLNGAVCVSDESEYLKEEFINGENIIFYSLDSLERLPEMIKQLLNNPQKIQKISEAAYQKARKEHTWDDRVSRFINIVEQI